MIEDELDIRINEHEWLLQKIPNTIADGVLSEKPPSSKLLEEIEKYVARLAEVAAKRS